MSKSKSNNVFTIVIAITIVVAIYMYSNNGFSNNNSKGKHKKSVSFKLDDDDTPQERVFFNNTRFSADCCPSVYTSSGGCACMNEKQTKSLETRGGNDPYY